MNPTLLLICSAFSLLLMWMGYYFYTGHKQDLGWWKKNVNHQAKHNHGFFGWVVRNTGTNFYRLTQQIQLVGYNWKPENILLFQGISLCIGIASVGLSILYQLPLFFSICFGLITLICFFGAKLQLTIELLNTKTSIRNELADYIDVVCSLLSSGVGSPRTALHRAAIGFNNKTSQLILGALSKMESSNFAAGIHDLHKIGSPELSKFARLIQIATEKGVSIAEVLGSLSQDLRHEQTQKLEAKVQSRGIAIMFISLIFILIPTGFIMIAPIFWSMDLSILSAFL